MAGTITIPISVPDLGVIEVSKDKGGLGLAPLNPNQLVQRLADALNEAGLTTLIYENYQAMKWSKLLLNIVNNASSAILDEPPAQIIANPHLFNLEIEALREGVAVMNAQGLSAVKLPGYPADWLARLVSINWLPLSIKRAILRPFMVSGRGTKMPSLHIDLEAGRTTTEVNVLNGAIVAVGQATGVATPVNKVLTDTLNSIVSGQSAWADYRHQPEKLLQTVENI
jgi:2-dehydropantoate 2-reductase